ncbi:allatostatins MIP isoform X2 [Condylostylus longicornis]|uniref:allatostatins MIP isoform X2 n=1 Tax=Condylostylus longicornis TaxID=2530218 RepID=UPI00244E1D51|nr:allatostatins MIP isoform X2 [Condylostylus longicornis]
MTMITSIRSSSVQLKNNIGLNIGKIFNIKMFNMSSFLYIILFINYLNCKVYASGGGGGSSVSSGGNMIDTKNSLQMQDSRMLPPEVYPWNILGVPDYSIENDVAKRSSWQKLHGTWGKRNILDNAYHNMENFDETNNVINGAGGGINNPSPNNIMSNNNIEGENDNDLHDSPTDRDYQELIKFEEIYSLPSSIINDLFKPNALYNEKKRAWRNLNVAWGKRRPNNEWNKFRGAWGKREPGWNNLKGLWGKRASNWNKLNSAWGKRSTEDVMETN